MKAIMIMYDSMCRDLLPCYGGKIELPNFKRCLLYTSDAADD